MFVAEDAFFVRVPGRKPLREPPREFVLRNYPVFIAIQRRHKSIAEKHARAESAPPAPPCRPAKSEISDGFTLRPSRHLIDDRLPPAFHKAFDRIGRLKESTGAAKSRTFPSATSAAGRATDGIAARTGPPEAAVKTGRWNGLASDDLVEARQFFV